MNPALEVRSISIQTDQFRAQKMNTQKILFILGDFSQRAVLTAVHLKLKQILRRDTNCNKRTVVISYHQHGRWRECKITAHLDAFDNSCGLDVSVGINDRHPADNCPLSIGWKFRQIGVQRQNFPWIIGRGKLIRLINIEMFKIASCSRYERAACLPPGKRSMTKKVECP